MKGKIIKQKRFVWLLMKRIKHRNERLAALTDDDLNFLVTEFWEEIAERLREGKRVVFEGWISFFTKPVKRKCYNMHKGEPWWTWKMRIRNNNLSMFRDKAEVDIGEEEYLRLKEKK